jgi:Mrp family chromosome partitioning ATPase
MNGFVFERFQNVSSEYDIVLIDAAPILISAETEYLARMADVTVLVSEAGKTKKAWLTRSARLLERLGVAGAAAVVNKVNPARAEEALKHDLREFELRSDRVNLQEWWRPGKKSARKATAAATPFESGKTQADEEDVVFARDI